MPLYGSFMGKHGRLAADQLTALAGQEKEKSG
jgi:hypothetical protein